MSRHHDIITMNKYTFYIEGLNREIVEFADSQKAAHRAIWGKLTHEEKNRVVIFDCIDVEPA